MGKFDYVSVRLCFSMFMFVSSLYCIWGLKTRLRSALSRNGFYREIVYFDKGKDRDIGKTISEFYILSG